MQSHIAKLLGRIDWHDLRIVLEVARANSIKGAAVRLQSTESTVSRHVVSVEQLLGADLFERTPRGMTLTTPGEQLIDYLFRAEAEIEAGLEAARNLQSKPSGVVRLTSVPLLANHLLAPASKALLSAYPDLELELIGTPADLSMRQREADLAIRLSRPSSDLDALTRRLGELDYGVFARRPDEARPRPDAEIPWITYERSMGALPQARWIEKRVEETGDAVCGLKCNDGDGLLAAVRAGAGKTLLPRLVAANYPELEEYPNYSDLPVRELWLLVHQNVSETRRIRVVIDWLTNLFAKDSSQQTS